MPPDIIQVAGSLGYYWGPNGGLPQRNGSEHMLGLLGCPQVCNLLTILELQCYTALLFSIKESQKKLLAVCPGGSVSLDDRLHHINQSLRPFCEGGGMMFPVEEVCGGKGLVDKCPPPCIWPSWS
jgi:hypothetical protein